MSDRLPPSPPGDVEESTVEHGIPLPTAFLGERAEAARISVMNALAGWRSQGETERTPSVHSSMGSANRDASLSWATGRSWQLHVLLRSLRWFCIFEG